MPKYNYSFTSPDYIEKTIIDSKGVFGTIRIKPSSILWKAKGQHKFHAVDIETFAKWILDKNTGAKKVSS
ncbi:MAG: hypothetical protein K1000chlam4_00345 [Chlamydiae bacterium]|nr:hypothetical protein [Chlamydiota bacterium]